MTVELLENTMAFEQQVEIITFEKNKTKFEFLPTGDVFQFLGEDILINKYIGNSIDGSANNLYMRVYENGEVFVTPLLGIKSTSKFSYNDLQAKWTGEFKDITYEVTFTLANDSVWFWNISVTGENKEIDFIYAQDISVANKDATTTNELYMSQYLDHVVLQGEQGYVISSRQNQTQGGRFPYLQQGSLNTKIIGYSTDGMQFFGKEFKFSNKPVALEGNLANENYQFELSYVALQTEKLHVNSKENVVFYGVFKNHHENAVTEIECTEEVKIAYSSVSNNIPSEMKKVDKIELKKQFGVPFVSEEFTKEELEKYFGKRVMEEVVEGRLLSFFTPDHAHVVMPYKECLVERPHGHIITSGMSLEEIPKGLITSTNYIYGIFNAQVVVGNTTLNKLMSTPRGLLNINKNSGQRIYIKTENAFQLLTMPAAYELGMNYAKWFYKINGDVLTVTSFSAKDQADIVLNVQSEKGIKYEFIITNQLVMGGTEFQQPALVEQTDRTILIKPVENSFLATVYPHIQYKMHMQGTEFSVSDDRIFFEDEKTRNGALLTLTSEQTSQFTIVMQGRLEKEENTEIPAYSFSEEVEKFSVLYHKLTRGFKLSLPGEKREDIDKLNHTFWWYTHNAMVHYTVPHGLEQPGGAAWGTRDVCQGPMEYFLMGGHFDLVKKIIEQIFSHQFIDNHEWPQWFMFDKYNMQQDDSHGDVVFWPLKALGDYIRITGDKSILDSQVAYRHMHTNLPTEATESILDHVKHAIKTIRERYLFDTALINYAGGDWDDTLQPANKALKEKLVSSWTVSLAYQTIKQLGVVLQGKDNEYATSMTDMSTEIKEAFHQYLIKDDVIAGFAYCENENEIEYMLHPDDTKTGINYRLLPMTRSIISELVSPEQAKKNIEIIEEHLTFSDGVRLMNRPATYRGGVIQFFQRAEQASNVGREVGLQYVHAHIRFIEAMAKIGSAEKAWEGLLTINPINIHEQVSNAAIRQSNAYFSSSDGAFTSRYDFQDNFDKLRTKEVEVKGGWRIYSSGPGIYLNQVVTNVLGIRSTENHIIIDPVLPTYLNGLRFEYEMEGKVVTFVYHIENVGKEVTKVVVNDQEINFADIVNPYRKGGARIEKGIIHKLLQVQNEVHIHLK